MKVLFAVSNENTSQAIKRKYQTEYREIISCKNVYYFNAILKELQRDKTYDRIVISEDLEQYVNTDYEQMDKFLFDKLDSISDEASNINGEDIPIILLCTERRNKSEQILVKLFGIGIYNAILGNDRSTTEVCKLINRPRSKKEAKIYYKIDADDVTYGKEDENDVSELEIQNILTHYKKIGNDEDKYVESFDSIAEQYNDAQLKVISKCLPLNVRAVLEERSAQYQKINSFNNKLTDKVRIEKKKEKKGTSEILLNNDKAKNLSKPVVIPSAIDASKKKKILTKVSQTRDNFNTSAEMQQKEIGINEENMEEVIEQPIKRGRGRPRKNIETVVEEQPKRKRGRPKKNAENETSLMNENEDKILISEDMEETSILPGLNEEDNDVILPGFEEDNKTDSSEFKENNIENEILPGIAEENEEHIIDTVLPGIDESNEDNDEEDALLPGFEEENQYLEKELEQVCERNIEEKHEENFNIHRNEEHLTSEFTDMKSEKIEYPELDMNKIITSNQKLVAFVGTSKNGTSFLVNNVAEILSGNGINTAIIDLTQNRNSYYIYTKNNEQLRNQSNYITNNLKVGTANGIIENKNLTIYTSPIEGDENLEAVEPIIETLVQNHTVVLMDCDFMTPMKYFKYAQEIYLVQSMDVLTIQPLTAFVRQLVDKGMFEQSKARVVLNKFVKTKEINQNILIGGMSIYNDPGMTVRKELFDRKTVKSIAIPFDLKSYLKYLDGLVTCDISVKGYGKDFLQYLKALASMVYNNDKKKKEKHISPTVKNSNSDFSPKVNNTLDQMKKNY